jgi:hypothetical protein
VPSAENRAKIDAWVGAAPDNRVVETVQRGDRWTTQALEDGEVRYEETEFGLDEPELNLLTAWCDRQMKAAPRPPVKTSGAPRRIPAREGRLK